ncbi:MAG: SRPBCC domain-containing protein [Tabrizicola sp.]|jgi:uncharacterized protein YndB with AHSA1/START domain|uniref:SRPBCC domain-containing protein n=1 Tax=Tabrizicola sp. TaxID=2005166 RepID=UPI002C6347BF|nr:SRPBCC domain-containing protein [Paracoccaceae bacterium]
MPWLSIHEDLTSPFETRRPGQIEVGAVVAESELSRGHVVHATTVVERTYNVSTARAFEQWCQPDAHHIWHLPAEGWVVAASDRDVVPGGRDFCRFGRPGAPIHHSDGRFLLVEQDRCVVSAGTMYCDDVPTSATLCTVEFIPLPDGGVRLVVTDQSAYFAGRHDPAGRERGWQIILEKFGEALA